MRWELEFCLFKNLGTFSAKKEEVGKIVQKIGFSLSVGYHPTKKFNLSVPPLITIGKKISLITFRQILPKSFACDIYFQYTIMTNLKKVIGTKSLHTKQCPAGLSLRTILHYPSKAFWKTLRMGGKSKPSVKHLLIFVTRKVLLSKFTYSAIKRVIADYVNLTKEVESKWSAQGALTDKFQSLM